MRHSCCLYDKMESKNCQLTKFKKLRPSLRPYSAVSSIQKSSPFRESWHRAAMTEGVPAAAILFLFFCTKCSAGRVFLLTSGQMFRTIFSSMESKTLYAGFCVTPVPVSGKACLFDIKWNRKEKSRMLLPVPPVLGGAYGFGVTFCIESSFYIIARVLLRSVSCF